MLPTGDFWSLTIVAGPVILGVIIAYALIRRRKLTPRERESQRQATEDNYRLPEE